MSAEVQHIWSCVQAELAGAVGEETYRIWLEPLQARELAHGRLTIQVHPRAHGWVRDRFGPAIQACATNVLGRDVEVELISAREPDRGSGRGGGDVDRAAEHTDARWPTAGGRAGGGAGAGRLSARGKAGATHDTALAADPVGAPPLPNPKLTFEQFVIGDCNRLAHAAALTVAEMPGQAYNPLFLCGPPGVGKTHLLHSIAGLVLAHSPGLAVRVTTGEAFTNEFLSALSGRNTERFKARFRDVDVLLVDDVQFLERKARTEEEFFHTFNALYEGGRQIVLSSDRPPRDLQALEDRLRERFEAGLLADIGPPDFATRMAILRKRAQHDGIGLADEAPLRLIAERVPQNVRALEGALIRVVAYSSLTGRRLDEQLTREVLDGLYPPSGATALSDTGGSSAARGQATPGAPSIDAITALACERFGLTPDELLSSSRAARVAWPRQVAMYLARELTGESLPAIGRQFGGRDHTTVLHAYRRTAKRIVDDEDSRRLIDSLTRELCMNVNTTHKSLR